MAIVGKWWCFGSLSGRNGEYDYGADGVLRIAASDGRHVQALYQVSGRRIGYQADNVGFVLDIESITADRMVQLVGQGQRLACDRRR